MKDQIEEIKNSLEELKDEEEEYRDNMPENLQGSERYDAAELAVDDLEEALGEAMDKIDSASE